MRSGLAFVAVLCLCIGMTTGGKPGKCPKPTGAGVCLKKCTSDYECPGRQKCCFNGCGQNCEDPVFYVKPGECPTIKFPPGLPCKLECRQDSNCKGREKCCRQGCSNICFPAAKPGTCPRSTGPGLCVEECSSDYKCPRNLKCCSNGCGLTCQSPVLYVKPGECPKFKLPPGLPCKLECRQDSDCKGREKCCPQGCSNVCFPASPAA
uniref:Uncharacterized protein isoform X1 n=1 Tax=Pogona vitticeps TaxID=103695 RepID=A0ABM5G4U4_9SAUR